MVYDPATSSIVLVLDDVPSAAAETWTWDGSKWTEQHPAASPPESVGDLLAFDASTNSVLLFDGTQGRTTWSWDGTNWTQLHPSTSPPDAGWSAMTGDPATGSVVLFGGALSLPDGSTVANDTWTWDGVNWTERHPVTSPPPRAHHQLAYDPAQQDVVLFGGGDANGMLADTWSWDGTNWTQRHPSTSPPPLLAGGMAYDASTASVILEGGVVRQATTSFTWSWDGSNWTELHPSQYPASRGDPAMAYDAARSEMILFGGTVASANTASGQDDTWLFGPPPSGPATTWTALDAPASPPARKEAAIGAYPGWPTILFGGVGASGVLADTWDWDGHTWTNEGTGPGLPPPATLASIATDPAAATGQSTTTTVMFGGRDATGHALGDTWTHDFQWKHATPVSSPPARYAASMSAATGAVVLFGGATDTGVLADTWTWNGSNWTLRHPASSPSGRQGASMAYDRNTGLDVLFGGVDGAGRPLGDTWTWDGTTWTQVHPAASPTARSGSGMVFDGDARSVILSGGTDASGVQGDTWSFDGNTWTAVHPTDSPPARTGAAMVFDPHQDRTLLFGGDTGAALDAGTWVLSPPAPTVAALIFPAPGQTAVDCSSPFVWARVPDAQAYALAVGTTRFGHDLVNSGLLPPTQTSYLVPALPVSRTLFATILTERGGVWTYHDLTFTSAGGGALYWPTDGLTGVTSSVFSWTSSGYAVAAQAYLLLVGSRPFTADVASSGVLPGNLYSFTTPPLPLGKKLYATLLTEVGDSWTRYSAVSFTTAFPPPATFTYPVDGQTGVDVTKPFAWTPVANVQAYALAIGTTKFGSDLLTTSIPYSQTSYTVPATLPKGKTLYATILTQVGGVWTYSAITFTR